MLNFIPLLIFFLSSAPTQFGWTLCQAMLNMWFSPWSMSTASVIFPFMQTFHSVTTPTLSFNRCTNSKYNYIPK